MKEERTNPGTAQAQVGRTDSQTFESDVLGESSGGKIATRDSGMLSEMQRNRHPINANEPRKYCEAILALKRQPARKIADLLSRILDASPTEQ